MNKTESILALWFILVSTDPVIIISFCVPDIDQVVNGLRSISV